VGIGYRGARLRAPALTKGYFSYGDEGMQSRPSRCRPTCRISFRVTGCSRSAWERTPKVQRESDAWISVRVALDDGGHESRSRQSRREKHRLHRRRIRVVSKTLLTSRTGFLFAFPRLIDSFVAPVFLFPRTPAPVRILSGFQVWRWTCP